MLHLRGQPRKWKRFMKQLLIALIVSVGLVGPARAEAAISSGITVADAWARATPGGAKTAVVYLTLVNHGPEADRLISLATPVADQAQLHVESLENGVMKMRPLAELDVKPGATAVLKPGASHVMLVGLKQPLKEGETFPLALDFARAGRQQVQVKVAKIGAMGPSGKNPMATHDMSDMEMMKH
jgi:periplasmic copper chaperone A